jgi:hypothetical protein
MKTFKTLLPVLLLLLVFGNFCGRPEKSETKKGGHFNFKNFKVSTQSLYKEYDQSEIKALRLSFREIIDSVPANNYLFNPPVRVGDRTSVADLLLWAIENNKIKAYDVFSDSDYFNTQISWEEIKSKCKPYPDFELIEGSLGGVTDTIIMSNEINTSEILSYMLMESTLYDQNNKVLEVRPIGLCPIISTLDVEIDRRLRKPLFWVYFPDIMGLLSKHIPEIKMKGIKTTLDFFTKNHYEGNYSTAFNFSTPMLEARLYGDTTRFVEGFDVSWLYEKMKDGIFINPCYRLYQGLGKKEMVCNSEISKENIPDASSLKSAKYIYKTINLRDVENYPLYFPELRPYLGQKSLIDVIYSGIKERKITVYYPSDQRIQMSLNDVEKAMGKEARTVQIQNFDGNLLDTLIWVNFTSSEVKKYIIKEVGFYNDKGTLIDSRIIGLVPVREYFSNMDETSSLSELFFIPFTTAEVKKILAENFSYRFTADDNLTFLSFFNGKKYKVESTKDEPVSVSDALLVLGN